MNILYAFDYLSPMYITPPEIRSTKVEDIEKDESCLCPCPCPDDKKPEDVNDEGAAYDDGDCKKYKGILQDVFAQTYEKEINEMQEAEMLFNLTELSYRPPFTLELYKIKERLPEKSRSIMILQEPQITTTIINEKGEKELVTLKPDYLILYERKYLIAIETKALGKLKENMIRLEKETITQLERYTNLAPFVILTDYNLFQIYKDGARPAYKHSIQHVIKKGSGCSDLGVYKDLILLILYLIKQIELKKRFYQN